TRPRCEIGRARDLGAPGEQLWRLRVRDGPEERAWWRCTGGDAGRQDRLLRVRGHQFEVAVRPQTQQGVVGPLAGVLAAHGSVQAARAGEFSYQVGEVGADVEQVVEYQVTLPKATSRA